MTQRYCPDCESPLPPDAPEGICPEFSQGTTLSVEPIDNAREENLPNPGDQFGEYRIERDLGCGGIDSGSFGDGLPDCLFHPAAGSRHPGSSFRYASGATIGM